jgi:hypothetical protein
MRKKDESKLGDLKRKGVSSSRENKFQICFQTDVNKPPSSGLRELCKTN